MQHIFAIALIYLTIAAGVFAQTSLPQGSRYSLHGDVVTIQVDDTGNRHVHATGNVHLMYMTGPDTWQLSAGELDYVEARSGDTITGQSAIAEKDIDVSGPGISLMTEGKIDVDILTGHIASEGASVHATSQKGELTTDRIEVTRALTGSQMTVNTYGHTSATFTLAGEAPELRPVAGTAPTSLFGSLAFDFSHISVDTEKTILLVENGKPSRLDCPDSTVITSSTNTVHMPSCSITFDPPVLRGLNGVEIGIGESITVDAASFVFSYPPNGGMTMELSGDESSQVTITHPQGKFYADVVKVSLSAGGARRIEANGHTKFEVPMGKQNSVAAPGA